MIEVAAEGARRVLSNSRTALTDALPLLLTFCPEMPMEERLTIEPPVLSSNGLGEDMITLLSSRQWRTVSELGGQGRDSMMTHTFNDDSHKLMIQ